METIAVYWEPVIRVYGLDIKPGAGLVELYFPLSEAELWASRIESIGEEPQVTFIMVLLQQADTETVRICVVLPLEQLDTLTTTLSSQYGPTVLPRIRQSRSVDVLFFHGPHFQDRYGIAEAAFSALDPSSITLHAAGCTGTSIYMIVDGGEAERTREMLSKAFTIPAQATGQQHN